MALQRSLQQTNLLLSLMSAMAISSLFLRTRAISSEMTNNTNAIIPKTDYQYKDKHWKQKKRQTNTAEIKLTLT